MFQESKSLLERYALAKQCGFSTVECAFPYDFPVEEVKKAKEREGLDQILINAYPGDTSKGELGFAALPGKEKEFQDSISKAITYAKALDCRKVHIMAGPVASPTAANDDAYKSNLLYAVNLFEKEQIVGLIEPINPFSVPNYFLNSFEKGLSFLKEINSPNLKMQVDIFHLQMLSGNLSHNLRRYLPYTGHIQVAQVPDRHEPDSDGEINYCYVFKLLKELNYSEWIGLEYFPANDSKSGLKWLEMLNNL